MMSMQKSKAIIYFLIYILNLFHQKALYWFFIKVSYITIGWSHANLGHTDEPKECVNKISSAFFLGFRNVF